MCDIIDALYANSNLGYRNCRVTNAEIDAGPMLDPFRAHFGANGRGHLADVHVEVRVN
jgi:hypothetical protein